MKYTQILPQDQGGYYFSYFYLYLVLLRDHYDEQCFDVVGHVTGDVQANIYAMSIHGGCTE